MKIGICLPSRGLIHSRTIEGVDQSIQGFEEACGEPLPVGFFISHDKPIPDCFNDTVSRAMEWGAEYIWIVEEDIVPDADTLSRLADKLLSGADVACNDYILENGRRVTVKHENGIQVTGTGCILVKREVFEQIGQPYFKTNIDLMIINGELQPNETDAAPKDRYGYHDAFFYWQCKNLGAKVEIIESPLVKHLRVTEMGAKYRNDGFHIVREL